MIDTNVEWYWIMAMCLFAHIVADFHVQGILAKMKQKCWWYDQPEMLPLYSRDYIAALLIHGFEWAFIMMIPVFLFIGLSPAVFGLLILNALIHSGVDHMKCNLYKMSLIEDQTIHICQTLATVALLFF